MSDRIKAWPHAGSLASVALLAAAFPPLEWEGLIWIALVPWLHGLTRCASLREAAIQGFWLHFLFGGVSTYWIVVAVPAYLGVSQAAGVFALVLHALVGQLHLVVFAVAFSWMARRVGGALLIFAGTLLFVGLDWAVPNLFQDTIGLPLHANPILSQLVELGGIHTLSVLVAMVNLGIAQGVVRRFDPLHRSANGWGRDALSVALVGMILAAAFGVGASLLRGIEARMQRPQAMIEVGVVQGAVSNERKRSWARGDPEAAQAALETYLEATVALLREAPEIELIVWPETAYPGIFRKPENETQLGLNVRFDRFVARIDRPIVFGAYDRENRSDRRVLQNAMVLVTPMRDQPPTQLSPMRVYHKHILFPVGETLPGFDESRVRRWLPGAASFSAGEGARLLALERRDAEPIQLGPSICYEDLFASHITELAARGAQLLVNLSNDGWFRNLGEPRFHLIFARLRSIETRLSQIRATNSGFSAVILPNGEMPRVSSFGAIDSFAFALPILDEEPTLATRHPEWVGRLSAWISLGVLLAVRFVRSGSAASPR